MKTEDHLRLLIGDMVFKVAQLSAELDTVKQAATRHGTESSGEIAERIPHVSDGRTSTSSR